MRSEFLIEAEGLTKVYSTGRVAVEQLDLAVRNGEVYGFVGANGAGKTTTLRMLVGLLRPTSGTALVMGYAPGTPEGLRRTGTMLETAAFYPHLSGRANLRILAHYIGCDEKTISRALERVDLGARADDRLKDYSLGMRQRLALAAALLKEPTLLILDEPTNGLDLAGIVEMRTLIRSLGDQGHGVLLSSHQLNEVQLVCDRVGVIRNGRMVAEGPVAEIRRLGERSELRVRVGDVDAAVKCVSSMPEIGTVSVVGDTADVLSVVADRMLVPDINRALVTSNIDVHELRIVERSLEDVVLQLTASGEATRC